MLVFEMLAGYPPFYSEDRMEVIDMRTNCVCVRACVCVPLCTCVRESTLRACVRVCIYAVNIARS